jgi:hypothetical protein
LGLIGAGTIIYNYRNYMKKQGLMSINEATEVRQQMMGYYR